MVKQRKKHNRKRRVSKGYRENGSEARKINASTAYDTCTEQITPFGGLLGLIKFIDLIKLKEIFDNLWFVEAHVWAASRSDGKGFSGRDYDNPGCFFLRVQNGWVFIPEGKFPEIIAFGKWFFSLSG